MIFDEDGALANSTYVTNLIFDDFNISMETTGGNESWINENNEIHKRIIHNMVRAGLIDSNQHEKNGSVNQRHHHMSIDVKYTVH